MFTANAQRALSQALPTAVPAALAVIGAIFSRYAVPFPFRYSMSFVPLAVAALLYLLYGRCAKRVLGAVKSNRRLLIVSIVMGLLFSAFLVLGSWGVAEDAGAFGALNLVAIIVNALPLSVLFVLLMDWLDGFAQRTGCTPERSTKEPLTAYPLRRAFIVGIILLICWLPIFLAAFPGFFCYDLGSGDFPEWWQIEDGYLNDHQPVFHTLLIGGALSASVALTGSVTAGIAVFTGLQALIISVVFAFLVRTVRLTTGSRGLEIASIVYLALDPLVSMFVMCITKDTLFSACVVLLALLLYGHFSRPAHERRISSMVAIGACMLIACLLRTNAIFAIVIVMAFLIAFEAGWQTRVRWAGACAVVLVLCGLWFGPAAAALGVNPSPIKHATAFSLPGQQLTYTVENEELTAEERSKLLQSRFGVFRDEGWEIATYVPENADHARNNLYNVSTADLLRLYGMLGLAYPQDYLHVFVEQTQAAWNPYAYAYVYRTGIYEERETSLFAFLWEEPAESQSLAPWLLEPLRAFSTTLDVQNIPLLSLLASLPLYLWLLLLAAARALVTLDKRTMVPCILFGTLALMAVVGPCQLARYYLYLIFGLPALGVFLLTARPAPAKAEDAEEPARSSGNGAVDLTPRMTGDR